MIIISVIYDIVWLIIFTKPWVDNNVLFLTLEKNIHLYEVIMSYIVLVNKVILFSNF